MVKLIAEQDHLVCILQATDSIKSVLRPQKTSRRQQNWPLRLLLIKRTESKGEGALHATVTGHPPC